MRVKIKHSNHFTLNSHAVHLGFSLNIRTVSDVLQDSI